MIDINTTLLTDLVTALQGNVTYNASVVNVYSEFNPGEESVYILLQQPSGTDNSNKAAFVTNATILIDIVHKTMNATYDVVNSVAGQVINILQPTPQTAMTSSNIHLKYLNIKKDSDTSFMLPAAEQNTMRRLLRYSLSINEI